MYRALSAVLNMLSSRDGGIESWLVCLTDGVSDTCEYHNFQQQLMASPPNLHMISIGINLSAQYEQNLQNLCQKFGVGDPKGFFVRSDGSTTGMDNAFAIVKSRIPVSQTFAQDGALSDDECHEYILHYLPSFVHPNDMISQSFWIRFLYRRVKVFDNNDSFNYNETQDTLGGSLMEVMLSEVKLLLGKNLRRDWLDTNHAQLIYDFANPAAPEFRLICTAPEKIDSSLRQKLSSLQLPGFFIPTKADLGKRSALDRFLSQALDIPLQRRTDGTDVLQCIDDSGFILTLDFTMKLLSIHERVACRIPCLIEGETGVSKSALTKMYAILRNSSLLHKARVQTATDLDDVEHELRGLELNISDESSTGERLRQTLLDRADDIDFGQTMLQLLHNKMSSRPPIFAEPTTKDTASAKALLDFFTQAVPEKTFFNIDVDSSLTEDDFVEFFIEIRAVAQRLQQCDATVVVFLDGTFILHDKIMLAAQKLNLHFTLQNRDKHIIRSRSVEGSRDRSQHSW